MTAQPAVRTFRRLVALCILGIAGMSQAQVTTKVEVVGAVAHPMSLSVDDLRQLPVRTVEERRAVGEGNARAGAAAPGTRACCCATCSDKAEVVEAARHDKRRTVIVATASDGYRVVFSWAELYLSPVGDGVLVVVARDGKPLDDREGRIALISLRDTSTGPRHVRWLQRLEVVRVGGA